MAGRKHKLNDTMIDRVYEYTRAGHYANTVSELLGISERTYYSYLKRGEEVYNLLEDNEENDTPMPEINEDDMLFLQFFQSIKRANAEAEQVALERIQKAGKRNWQANAWFLERRFPSKWRLRQESEIVVGEDTGNKMDDFISAMKTLAVSTKEGE